MLGGTEALSPIPIVFAHLDAGKRPVIFGDDDPTPAGTRPRDYVRVVYAARASCDTRFTCGEARSSGLRAGICVGTSVREMILATVAVVSSEIELATVSSRSGDAIGILAAVHRIPATTR